MKKSLTKQKDSLARLEQSRGFTLVEMVVVIGIIMMVMAIIVGNLDTAKSQSRDRARVSDIANLSLALESYYARNKSYPDTLDDLVTKGIIPVIPRGPKGEIYKYVSLNTTIGVGNVPCHTYHLGAVLESSKNEYLDDDSDFDSSSADSGNKYPKQCGGARFNGADTDPTPTYDLKSKY